MQTSAFATDSRHSRVILPYRARQGGAAIASLTVRPITGDDELAIDEAHAEGHGAARLASLLIGACARDGDRPIGADEARALSVGDREIVLRRIYAVTFSSAV